MNQKKELYSLTLDVLRLSRYATLDANSPEEAQSVLQHAFDLTQYVIKNAHNDTMYPETRAHILQVKQSLEHAKPLSIVQQNIRSVSNRLSHIPDDINPREVEQTIVQLFKRHHIESAIIDTCLFSEEVTEFISPLSTGYLIFSILAAMYMESGHKKYILVHPMALSKELDRAVFFPPAQDAVRVVIIDDVIDSGDTMRAAIIQAEKNFPTVPVYPSLHKLY